MSPEEHLEKSSVQIYYEILRGTSEGILESGKMTKFFEVISREHFGELRCRPRNFREKPSEFSINIHRILVNNHPQQGYISSQKI